MQIKVKDGISYELKNHLSIYYITPGRKMGLAKKDSIRPLHEHKKLPGSLPLTLFHSWLGGRKPKIHRFLLSIQNNRLDVHNAGFLREFCIFALSFFGALGDIGPGRFICRVPGSLRMRSKALQWVWFKSHRVLSLLSLESR